MQIKNDGNITVECKRGVGYTIRHRNCVGATFTVTEYLTLAIGQSSRMRYSMEEWREIQAEIEKGVSYMAKVKMMGVYPFEVNNVKKPEKITPKNYENCCIYLDNKDRIILYIGRACIIRNNYGFDGNPEYSSFVCGFIDDKDNFINAQTDGINMNINVHETNSGVDLSFAQRVNKPAGFVKKIFQGAGTETCFFVNEKPACQIRRY